MEHRRQMSDEEVIVPDTGELYRMTYEFFHRKHTHLGHREETEFGYWLFHTGAQKVAGISESTRKSDHFLFVPIRIVVTNTGNDPFAYDTRQMRVELAKPRNVPADAFSAINRTLYEVNNYKIHAHNKEADLSLVKKIRQWLLRA